MFFCWCLWFVVCLMLMFSLSKNIGETLTRFSRDTTAPVEAHTLATMHTLVQRKEARKATSKKGESDDDDGDEAFAGDEEQKAQVQNARNAAAIFAAGQGHAGPVWFLS